MRQRVPWISNILPRKEGVVMRCKAKGVLFALLCLTTLLLLSACGGPESRIANTEKLKEDLSEQLLFKNYVDMLDISISDLEVIKRQTTVEDKTDQAWVHVDVSGPRVEGDMYYLMTYELYNDGWLLENVIENDRNQWHFVPLEGPTEDVWSWMLGNAENINTTLDLEAGYSEITWETIDSYTWCEFYYTKSLGCYFNSLSGLWESGEPQELACREKWHIDGTWVSPTYRRGYATWKYTTIIEGFDDSVWSYGHETDSFSVKLKRIMLSDDTKTEVLWDDFAHVELFDGSGGIYYSVSYDYNTTINGVKFDNTWSMLIEPDEVSPEMEKAA